MLVDENGQQRQRLKRGESYSKSRSWHIILVPSDTPGEIEALQWIFNSYVNDEIGCREIARRLNERGIKSPHDGTWGITTVRSILKNPVYKGQLVFGRRAMGSFHRVRNGSVGAVSPGEGRVVGRPEEEWVVHHRPEMALIAPEIWNSANAKMAGRGDRSKRAHARRLAYPLGGLICCAHCGKKMVGMMRDRKYQVYVCASHFRNKSCNPNTVRQAGLLALLKDVVKRHVFAGGNLESFRAEALRQAKDLPECQSRDTEKLRRELEKVKAKHQRAAENLLLADPENVPALNTAMNALRQEVRTLEAQLQSSRSSADPTKLATEMTAKAEKYLEDLFGQNIDRLKAVLSELIDRVELRFDWGLWGKRRVRLITDGSVYLRPILTTGYRGGGI
jgi:site-specific DNA recombinase